jgi:DNA-directed RNA polymerase subunit RPC12/RpoP
MGSPLVVDCPRCGRTLKYAGATAQVKAIRCPACSTRINIGARGAVTEEDAADPEQALPKRPPAKKPVRKEEGQGLLV